MNEYLREVFKRIKEVLESENITFSIKENHIFGDSKFSCHLLRIDDNKDGRSTQLPLSKSWSDEHTLDVVIKEINRRYLIDFSLQNVDDYFNKKKSKI